MPIFELLFLIIVLVFVVSLIVAVVNLLRGRINQSVKLLVRVGLGLVIYLAIVVVVALVAPQRIVALGEKRCFDDWCITVKDVALSHELGQGERSTKANGEFYIITLQLSNHARGREQRVSSAAVHLLDEQGQTYDISPQGQSAWEAEQGPALPLTVTIPVGQAISTVQVFDLPKEAKGAGLTVEHPVGPSPALFIIGDEASLFHKPTIVRLP